MSHQKSKTILKSAMYSHIHWENLFDTFFIQIIDKPEDKVSVNGKKRRN